MPGDQSKTRLRDPQQARGSLAGAERASTGEACRPGPSPGELHAPIVRASLDQAIAWIDAHSATLGPEEIGLDEAAGRVTASQILAPAPIPPADRAAADGYALRAAETVGASDYNPLPFALCSAGDALPASAAAPIVSGAALPGGADAVLPHDLAQASGAKLEVFGAVPQGLGVVREGRQLQAGESLIDAGRVLLPQHIGLLASAGIRRVQVVRRPRVRLLVFPPKPPALDANTPLLCTLIERDCGALPETKLLESQPREALAEALAHTLAAAGADLVLIAGRSGHGADDIALRVLADVGELAIHGVALRPGGSSSMGLVHGAPVLLLPGDPLECWSAFEMLAGRLIRRMGGRSPELPYARRQAEVGHKIVSAIGVVDLCRVRLVQANIVQANIAQGSVEPVGPAESGGLASAVRADGFVLVPAALEGFAPGTRIDVFVFEENVRRAEQF